MNKDSIIDFLGFIIVKAAGILFWCIPLGLALWIGRRLGDFVYTVNSKRRSIAYANLKSAFPEKDVCERKRILRSHYQNLGMSIVELLKIPIMGKRYLAEHVKIDDFDRIEKALGRGKGVILLGAHFGNWEIASLAVNSRGQRISVFARQQKYTRLNGLLNSYRGMTGCRVITKGFSIREIIKTLNDNGIVGMLVDQDAGASGVFVDFLNRPASTAQGPISFALKTGAAVLPLFIRRSAWDRHIIELGESLELANRGEKEKDIKANLEKVATILENYIRRYPDQWLWSHKRWKSSTQRTVLVLDDGKAGHLNQAKAIAEMVKEALGSKLKARGIEENPIVDINVVELRFKNKLARLLLELGSLFAGRRCQGCLRCLRTCLKKETFDEIKRYADIIISCGASTVGANTFLKYENNAKGIVSMKPGLGRSRKFDLVILPRHDAPKKIKSNMLVTETAPNRIVARSEPREARGIGVLIGGDAKNFRLEKEVVEKVISGVLKISEEMDRDVFVSTSRRTPPEIDRALKDRLSGKSKLLVIANEKNIEGAVQSILDGSEVVVVSPESISMISEAVSAGRYTVVFRSQKPETSNQNKYERVIGNLEKRGYITTAAPDEIYKTISQVLKERPAIRKLQDREKILERLKGII